MADDLVARDLEVSVLDAKSLALIHLTDLVAPRRRGVGGNARAAGHGGHPPREHSSSASAGSGCMSGFRTSYVKKSRSASVTSARRRYWA
jgi:hypothetical protein